MAADHSEIKINAKTQLSSSGIIITKREKSSTDVIRKASDARLLE
jgi:hypothetical protein